VTDKYDFYLILVTVIDTLMIMTAKRRVLAVAAKRREAWQLLVTLRSLKVVVGCRALVGEDTRFYAMW